MRTLNDKLPPPQRMVVTGRKDDIIQRFSLFISSCLLNDRKALITNIVHCINEHAGRKLSWKYEGNELKVNCRRFGRASNPQAVYASAPPSAINIEQINFVPNPFLKPIQRLSPIKVCPVAGQSRQSRSFTFTLTDANRQLLATPNVCDDRAPYQIRFYCARYAGRTDGLLVEFPSVCELKVNDTTIVGHNLRCLKGKPGTVNPPDLSIMSKKHAQNHIELVYINSDVSFIAGAYIVERTPVQSLIEVMKKTRVLSKEEVILKIQQIQEDAEIIMESETLSTKCPLAFTRIITPIRSRNCNHLQCFDATTFLTMNEQTPTWSCPVCYRRIENWEDLIVDEYFTEMLLNTPKHIASVRVETNGNITIIDENPDLAEESEEEEEIPPVKEEPEITILLDDDDDDEVDAHPSNQQPIPQSRAAVNSVAESSQPPRKKQKNDVIDLTFDSDEDDDEAHSVPSSRLSSDEVQSAIYFRRTDNHNNSVNSNTAHFDEAQLEEPDRTSNNSHNITDNLNESTFNSTDENNSSQQSAHEALILPHFATLYNNTTQT
ncbi:unnamed protein product [Mucor hiemalis]